MSRFTVVTFGTTEFSWAVQTQKLRALEFGAHRHIVYQMNSPAVVNARHENPLLASDAKGYGLWIWKPYVILDAISQCAVGDYVVYLDAGITPIADMRPWFAQLERCTINLFAPVPPKPLRQWTKRECFVRMGADTPSIQNAATLSAGIQGYRNHSDSLAFLAELKQWMRDPVLIKDPDIGDAEQYPEFIAHRHDQSVLGLLARLRGCSVQREPTQYGVWSGVERDRYRAKMMIEPELLNEDCPQVLDVHRGRNRSSVIKLHLWRMKRKLVAPRGIRCV